MVAVLVLFFVALTSIAFALAAVLLLRFWAGGLSPNLRSGLAVLFACFGPAILFGGVMFAERGSNWLAPFVRLSVLIVPLALIAWPAAHFATRKLDGLTQFEATTFE